MMVVYAGCGPESTRRAGAIMASYVVDGISLTIPDHMLTDRIAEKLATGAYEGDEAAAVRMRLRPGRRILELGAGLGFVAALSSRITGPENVTTVEANPDMLAVIRGNLARNGYGAARLLHGAVTGDGAGRTVDFAHKTAFWSAHLATAGTRPDATAAVPRLSLPRLLADHRPQMVVMDIEGAEAQLFDAPWPRFVRSVIIELHPGRYPDTVIKRIVDCLSASGMTYDPGPSRGRILGFRRLRRT
jgi:FkbM family methyltransferase